MFFAAIRELDSGFRAVLYFKEFIRGLAQYEKNNLEQNFFSNHQATQFWGPGEPAEVYAGIRVNWD